MERPTLFAVDFIDCQAASCVLDPVPDAGPLEDAAPTIIVPPSDLEVHEGELVVLSVVGTGYPAIDYQWEEDDGGGFANVGPNNRIYSFVGTAGVDGNQYRVTLSNGVLPNETSVIVTVVILPPLAAPSFITQPQDQSATVGNTATISCAVAGVPLPSVVLMESKNNGITWNQVGVGTSYTTPALALADDGTLYRFDATNSQGGPVSSDVITLAVLDYSPAENANTLQYSLAAGQDAY